MMVGEEKQNQCIYDGAPRMNQNRYLHHFVPNDQRDSKISTGHSDQHLPYTGCM